MRSVFLLLVFSVLVGPLVEAQSRMVIVGASVDGSRQTNSAGHVCGLLTTEGASTYSITCLSARGGGYDMETGAAQRVSKQGRAEFFLLGSGGIVSQDSATNGLFSGGPAVTFRINEHLTIAGTIRAAWSPVLKERPDGTFASGFTPRFTIGTVFKP